MDGVSRVHVVFATGWDRQQLAAFPDLAAGDPAVVFVPPDDADCPDDFDVLAFADAAARDWRGGVDGVFSSSDYPGAAVAAAIGTALGLPASPPEAIMRAAHKGVSRELQRRIAPEATPAFQVLDPDGLADVALTVPFPCYVKPAKGCFSVLVRRVEDPAQLRSFLRSDEVSDYRNRYLAVYRALAERHLGPGVDPTAFVAEEVITGRLVTVEGFCTGAGARPLGVIDSVRHPGTGSFVAFEYPSALPAAVQERMEELACRLAVGLGLRWTLFNVELMWDDAQDRIRIVEINARMCGQFADLYDKVDGVHGHAIAFDLARGREPRLRRRSGAQRCAASFPLRVFAPVAVERAPDAQDLRAAARLGAGTLVWNEVRTGERLDDFVSGDDGQSYRYAVVNVGGPDRAALAALRDEVAARLGYRFALLD